MVKHPPKSLWWRLSLQFLPECDSRGLHIKNWRDVKNEDTEHVISLQSWPKFVINTYQETFSPGCLAADLGLSIVWWHFWFLVYSVSHQGDSYRVDWSRRGTPPNTSVGKGCFTLCLQRPTMTSSRLNNSLVHLTFGLLLWPLAAAFAHAVMLGRCLHLTGILAKLITVVK